MCQRWLDLNNYRDINNTSHNINDAVIKSEANDFFDTVLNQAFESLESKGHSSAGLINEILEDVDKVIKGEIENVTRYFYNKFSSGTKDSYYAVVKGNLKSARDTLIESITAKIQNRFDDSQNIRYAELFMTGLKERIDETFTLWENFRIPKEPNQWNTLCTNELSQLLNSSSNILLQKVETLQDRLINLLNMLKMYLMRDVINDFLKNIDRGSMVSTKDPDIKLLTIENFKTYRRNVKEIFNNLEIREEKIRVEINDDTLPIFKIWRENNFQGDCQHTIELYDQQATGLPHSSDISQESL